MTRYRNSSGQTLGFVILKLDMAAEQVHEFSDKELAADPGVRHCIDSGLLEKVTVPDAQGPSEKDGFAASGTVPDEVEVKTIDDVSAGPSDGDSSDDPEDPPLEDLDYENLKRLYREVTREDTLPSVRSKNSIITAIREIWDGDRTDLNPE